METITYNDYNSLLGLICRPIIISLGLPVACTLYNYDCLSYPGGGEGAAKLGSNEG